ncbi:MAG: pilus assembly FimT family protein [Microbacterium sp.]|uniref:pilus assembly FimT family protein n=1 Tax=Microbacterium sp. TaxID=51671 RepID=UPI003F81F2ED
MRATIKNYIEAAKRRREEEGEEGFSLIELIIVVVILGILVAIAIPIFANISAQADLNAVKAAAANGATAAAAAFADDEKSVSADTAAESAGSNGITTAIDSGDSVTNVCVVAQSADHWAKAGPGCASSPSGTGTAP